MTRLVRSSAGDARRTSRTGATRREAKYSPGRLEMRRGQHAQTQAKGGGRTKGKTELGTTWPVFTRLQSPINNV